MFTPQLLLTGLAIFMLAIYLPRFFNPKGFHKAMKSVLGSSETIRMLSLSMFIIALFFLSVQWKLEKDWSLLIALMGWLTLLKGVVWLWNPDYVRKMMKRTLLAKGPASTIIPLIGILFAIALFYIATNYMELLELVSA